MCQQPEEGRHTPTKSSMNLLVTTASFAFSKLVKPHHVPYKLREMGTETTLLVQGHGHSVPIDARTVGDDIAGLKFVVNGTTKKQLISIVTT